MNATGRPDRREVDRSPSAVDDFVSSIAAAVGGVLLGVALALWFLVRHPRFTLLVGSVMAAFVFFGPTGLALALVAVLTVALLWRWLSPATFDGTFLGGWRRALVYAPRWDQTMSLTGLVGVHWEPEREFALARADRPRLRRKVPTLVRVRSDRWEDRVRVRLLAGQHPAQFEAQADALAHSFGATGCRVEHSPAGPVVLVFRRRDRLNGEVPTLAIPAPPDLGALPVGVLEDGRPWTVQLAGSHLLIAGATGSGKSSLVWSLLRAMAAAIRSGTVRVHAVDPKGGMELGVGARMFARFAHGDPEAMAALLGDTCMVLQERAQRMRAEGRRTHVASVADPLIVVLVDEVAFLTVYIPDQKLRKEIGNALSILLSQGRAVGVCVVAALQDPRKEVASFRDLFPQRIALRLTESEQTRLVLGPGAHERGARCEDIPPSLPGVGFTVIEGDPSPVRGRIGFVDDAAIAAMVATYGRSEGRAGSALVPGSGAMGGES